MAAPVAILTNLKDRFFFLYWQSILACLAGLFLILVLPFKYTIIPNYASYHTLLEVLCVFTSFMVFTVHQVFKTNNYLSRAESLALPFLVVGLIDLLHLLSFPGMPQFLTPNSAQKTVSLWLAARLLETATTLAFIVFPLFKIKTSFLSNKINILIWIYFSLTIFFVFIYHDLAPSFVDESGRINNVKIGFEYLFIALNLTAALLYFFSNSSKSIEMPELITSCIILAISGFAFTSYHNMSDSMILFGHVLKAVAYYFIFRFCLLSEIKSPLMKVIKLTDEIKKNSRDLRSVQSQLLHSEKTRTLGQTTGVVLHDINNMLFVTEEAAKNIQKLISDQPADSHTTINENISHIFSSLSKIKSLRQTLLQKISVSSADDKQKIDLSEHIRSMKEYILLMIAPSGAQIELDLSEKLYVDVGINGLEQCVFNLIINSKESLISRNNGVIKIRTYKTSEADNEFIGLSIEDNGCGIKPEHLEKIFDPSFTTKNSTIDGQHYGIGLQTVKTLIESWNGKIKVESKLNEGTKISLLFPRPHS